MGGEVGLVSIRWWELAMQAINILILFGALSYFLFKPVSKFMQERKDKIASELKNAKDKNTEAEDLIATYQQKIEDAKGEAQQIIRDAIRKGDDQRNKIVLEAEQESKAIMERTQVEAQREREKALDELKGEMIEISLAAASRVIHKSLNKEDHERLIQQYIDEMGDIHV
jgi:F-type H+-transporting ATPase subunit b